MKIAPDGSTIGKPHAIPQGLFDQRTVEVKPWWLYADYRSASPKELAGPDWQQRFPGFELALNLFVDPDGRPTTSIRVCKEEAQTKESGRVFATGRLVNKATPIPKGRTKKPPGDTAFARANQGQPVSCLTQVGFESSADCGCGVGLERCMPTAPPGFVVPIEAPLGPNEPFVSRTQPASLWSQRWWTEEAIHFLDRILLEDRDFREVLTSRASIINGPLAQFYRFLAGATLLRHRCRPRLHAARAARSIRAAVPDALVPEDTATGMPVADRGPARVGHPDDAGVPDKYGVAARAGTRCLQRVPVQRLRRDTVKLAPSTEPDLTKRPGCSSCHQSLEPLAAYFTRVAGVGLDVAAGDGVSDAQPTLRRRQADGLPVQAALRSGVHDKLRSRGAYAAPAHAEDGPRRARRPMVTARRSSRRASSQNVAQSLLGRTLAPEDDAWKTPLAKMFVDGGYRMKRARARDRDLAALPRRERRDERARLDRARSRWSRVGAATLAPTAAASRCPPRTDARDVDTTPKERRRMVPPEVYLRAYLDVVRRARAARRPAARASRRACSTRGTTTSRALGLPDYKHRPPARRRRATR